MSDFLLRIWTWRIFILNKNSLPTNSNNPQAKMEYEGMSGAFIWEDEGLWKANHKLQGVFAPVLSHRMQLLVGQENDLGFFRSKKFDKQIYQMAKKYFPKWIGFQESRNTFNTEIADRILRVKKVESWRYKKLMDEANN